MFYENIDSKIAKYTREKFECHKRGDTFAEETANKMINLWRSIKTEMINATHLRNKDYPNGMSFPNNENEIKILKMMLKQRLTAAEEFSKSDSELAKINYEANMFEVNVIKDLLPKAPTLEQTQRVTFDAIDNLLATDPSVDKNQLQKSTRKILDVVKQTLPTADNGVISQFIKKYQSEMK